MKKTKSQVSHKHYVTLIALTAILLFMFSMKSEISIAASNAIITSNGTISEENKASFPFQLNHSSTIGIHFIGADSNNGAFTSSQDFDIQIYDTNNNLVYSQLNKSTESNDLSFDTILAKGNYIIEITNHQGLMNYDIVVDATRYASEADPIYTLNHNEYSLNMGETVQLSIAADPQSSDIPTTTWKSSDDSIVTVDSTGNVTANTYGEATITAMVGSDELTSKITVTKPSLNKNSITIYEGKTSTLSVNNYTGNITWSSSDPTVATVSLGKITALKSGTTDITATFQNITLTSKVTVKKLKLNKTTTTLYTGCSETLTINETSKNVTWKSSNTKIATVNSGKITAIKAGTVTISASYDGITVTCKITVKNPNITIPSKLKVRVLDPKKIQVTVSPSNAVASSIVWKSSNTKIATVSSNGTVNAIAEGTCTITATLGDKSVKCIITVPKLTLDEHLYTQKFFILLYDVYPVDNGQFMAQYMLVNDSNKNVSYIEYTVYQYDINGKRLKNMVSEFKTGMSIPKNSYDFKYEYLDDSVWDLTVCVKKVKYTDGSTWTNPYYKDWSNKYKDKIVY